MFFLGTVLGFIEYAEYAHQRVLSVAHQEHMSHTCALDRLPNGLPDL